MQHIVWCVASSWSGVKVPVPPLLSFNRPCVQRFLLHSLFSQALCLVHEPLRKIRKITIWNPFYSVIKSALRSGSLPLSCLSSSWCWSRSLFQQQKKKWSALIPRTAIQDLMAAILLNSSVNKSPEKGLFPVIYEIIASYPFLWTSIVLPEKRAAI